MLVDLGGSELMLATNEWSRLAATHHAAGRGRQVHARNGIMMRLGNLYVNLQANYVRCFCTMRI